MNLVVGLLLAGVLTLAIVALCVLLAKLAGKLTNNE